MDILQALDDPHLFAPLFRGSSWSAWRASLAALFGLQMSPQERRIFEACTGRRVRPTSAVREAAWICGRRGGKSRVLALIAIYLATFHDYAAHLAPGEIPTIAIIAADRKQARVILRYCVGLMRAVPMLSTLLAEELAETLRLTNGVMIEIHTAAIASPRGRTFIAVLCDEIAFWPRDNSANPDSEVIAAVRPGLASIPGSMLLMASSPYARRGVLWETFRRHYGRDDARVLVWRGSTRTMNPTIDEAFLAEEFDKDPASAAAEYDAEFRHDIEGFVSPEVIDACTPIGRFELPPAAGVDYAAFVDPSGGSADSMTLAIAHRDGGRAVLDAVRERRPPFSPEDVVADFSTLLARYRIRSVQGDRYAGEWPRERFRAHGIEYELAAQPKSDIYRDLLPLLNSCRVELLDNRTLRTQIAALERRTARGGRDSIDHAPGAHDDVANAVAGILVCLAGRPDGLAVWRKLAGSEPVTVNAAR